MTMKHLVNKHILSSWEFQAPVCRNNYDDFANGMVEFQVRDTLPPLPPLCRLNQMQSLCLTTILFLPSAEG